MSGRYVNLKSLTELQNIPYERYTKIICPYCDNPMFVNSKQGECYNCGRVKPIEEIVIMVEEKWLEDKYKPQYNKGVGYD